ncbi:hypothetical protein ABT187_49850 [Streptomyces sp. NPDC001817]|uniref:hypothetical protein n=1 Tax=Streptomyces sp. NPDC001817 TaxID=3154398 RepID=UPI003328427A
MAALIGSTAIGCAVFLPGSAASAAPAEPQMACGDRADAWSGVFEGNSSTTTAKVHFQFVSGDPSGWVKVNVAIGEDPAGTWDLRPDGLVGPDNALRWKAGIPPIYKNDVEITSPKCDAQGKVTSAFVKAKAFPTYYFDGVIGRLA